MSDGIVTHMNVDGLRASARHNLTDSRTKHQLYWAAEMIESLRFERDRYRQALAKIVNPFPVSGTGCVGCGVNPTKFGRYADEPHADGCAWIEATRKEDQ